MQPVSGDSQPTGRRRPRQRPVRLLVALTASACLTIPLTGMVAQAASGTPAPSPLPEASANELRSTAADLWSVERATRASRPTVIFGDAAVEVPQATPGGLPLAVVGDGLVPPVNLNVPFVFGSTIGAQSVPLINSPYVSPVPGPVTGAFGPRFHPILHYMRNHNGVDMTAACGTPVVSMSDGVITRSATAGGYGLLVEVDHGTVDEDRMSSRYAHLSVLGVKVGDRVRKGQQIGLSGTTGLSTGCHLHFEVLINGAFVDPVAVLSGSPYIRLDTPMVPWTPGKVPTRPTPPRDARPVPAPGPVQPTPTPSVAPNPTPSPSVPVTPEPTPDPTVEPTPTVTPEPTPEPTVEPTPTVTPEPTPDPTVEPTPTVTPEPTPGTTPEPTPGTTPEPTHGPTATPSPEPAASPNPIPVATIEATPAATSAPTVAPTPVASPKVAKPMPTAAPAPKPSPTVAPAPSASPEPTPTPAASPETVES